MDLRGLNPWSALGCLGVILEITPPNVESNRQKMVHYMWPDLQGGGFGWYGANHHSTSLWSSNICVSKIAAGALVGNRTSEGLQRAGESEESSERCKPQSISTMN